MKFLLCLLVGTTLCVAAILAKSGCEKERKRALKAKENWIPDCTESGEFEPLQCKGDGSECMCVRTDGTRIKEFSSTLKSCSCHAQADKALAASRPGAMIIGVYKPQCEDDGSYRKKQCSGSIGSCWCVDEQGKKTKERDCLN